MKKSVLLFFCVTVVAISFISPKQIEASIPYPIFHWEVVFEEVDMIFYMTPTRLPSQVDFDWFNMPEISEERMQIRTGLYCITTRENIYYIDINAHKWNVFFSSCGRYIVTIQNTVDNFDSESLGGGLINFFDNGILVKSYGVEDLIINQNNLPWTTAGMFWRYGEGSIFDRERFFNVHASTLTITTLENNVFVFDITSGDVIAPLWRAAWFRYTVISTVLLAASAVIFIVYKRKR